MVKDSLRRGGKVIYLDNAATSWPKPPGVAEAMSLFLSATGSNPGRSGHPMAMEAERIRYDAREAVADLLGCPDPLRVVFTHNVTGALNLVLSGMLNPGDHVVTTRMEHNSVARPLHFLSSRGVLVDYAPCAADGTLDPEDLLSLVKPETRLVVMIHGSNVTGSILPVEDVARKTRTLGVPLLIDAAQTAGSVEIDMDASGISMVAFTGHKGLLGPTGTGGVAFGTGFDHDLIRPLEFGGTGSLSDGVEQPGFLPDKFESGTSNITGISGLLAALRYIGKRGREDIRNHETAMTGLLLEGLSSIGGVRLHGPKDPLKMVPVVSFTIDGMHPSEIGRDLAGDHGVMCRVGLHCSPLAHGTMGTFPAGTVRFAPGPFTTRAETERAIEGVARIAARAAGRAASAKPSA